MSDEDPEALAAKQSVHAALTESDTLRRERLRCDAWFACWTTPQTPAQATADDQPHDVYYDTHHGDLPAPSRHGVQQVRRQTRQHRFFHWHLAFPHIAQVGGFDVLLGNPPWERVKVQQEEWFAARGREDISGAQNAAARNRMINGLRDSTDPVDQALADDWDAALHAAAASSELLRRSGRFPLGGVGDVNLYAVFADHFLKAHNPDGAAGFLCPDGLATGATYAPFFAHVVDQRRLVSFWSFENEDRVFPQVHNETKFALVTFVGSDHPADKIGFTGYVRQATQIDDPDRRYTLTPGDIVAINPNTKTAPLFRHTRDAEITATIHRHAGVLINETVPADDPTHNPWRAGFRQGLFNMASDSHLFDDWKTAELGGALADGNQLVWPYGGRALPLYEGKMIWLDDHRYGTYDGQTYKQANKGVLPHTSSDAKADPDFRVWPRYWVDEDHVAGRLDGRWDRDWLIGWRDVGPKERTLIASVIPRVAAGDTMPLLFTDRAPRETPTLLAAISSLPVDYSARSRASRMKLFVVKQLPLGIESGRELPWGEPLNGFVAPRVAELTYTAWDLQAWATDIGFPGAPFRWDDSRRELLRAELDAAFFQVYGLDRDDAAHVLDTFTVLEKYEMRPAERGGFGEFRTKRLVLERYDAMVDAVRRGGGYTSPLDPPPADDRLRHPDQSRTASAG